MTIGGIGGIIGAIVVAVAVAFLIVLAFLSFLMPWYVYRIMRAVEDAKATLESVVGVLELTRREIKGLRENQGLQLEASARIERILSAAHNIKFED